MTHQGSRHTNVLRVVVGEKATYDHFFGGPPLHAGARFEGASIPLHLLHCFDLRDPLFDVDGPKLGNWLPLYYGVPFDGCEFSYLVESDERITIFSEEQTLTDDFASEPIYQDYPLEYPKASFRLEPLTYEQQKAIVFAEVTLHYVYCDGALDYISRDDMEMIKGLGYPFTQINGNFNLCQGETFTTCPNPDCEDFGRSWVMSLFCVVHNEPIPDLSLWGKYGDDVEIIYERCKTCGTIHVINRCT